MFQRFITIFAVQMRRYSFIALLLCAVLFMMANADYQFRKKHKRASNDSIAINKAVRKDSAGREIIDTTKMDSLQLAIYRHNKQIDDSIYLDSLNRQKKNGIDAPVTFSANDSMVYDAQNKTAFLYGTSNVKYENMDLKSERIYLNMDSSLVHATGVRDTATKGLTGTPVFSMGSDNYESDTMAFNFKSKKGLIQNVTTQQQEGFLSSQLSKRNDKGEIFLKHGRYTTCDKDCPDFYIALSRAKVRPGKDVVFGPAYLVVADVPLPLAIPYGFFPFSKKYSSGFIMPSYGDESTRGFYLRDGGYYFALSDKWDLKLLGEIYTKGSWGLSVATNYRKRYRYNGTFYAAYQDTKTGDKGLPDYTRQQSFKIQWSHRQDQKASPYSSLAASVNFATSSYERNNLGSLYNPQTLTQTTRTSSVSWGTNFSSIGLSLSATANLNQNMSDSSIALTLPDLNISLSRFYPFKRRHAVGAERWYEKISVSYTGQISNSINTKEDRLLRSNLIKDWRNGMQHRIPVSGNFTLFNYINVSPSFNFTDRMYTNKVTKSWNRTTQKEVSDTTYGFHNIYNWDLSLSASTKLYGMFIPNRKIFGDKIQAIRHVITPSVSFSYAPDFGSSRYGYYSTYQRTNADGSVELVDYSPYFRMSYNMAAKEKPWSDLSVDLRLKWWKNYTFNLNAVFASYAYELNSNGEPYVGNHTYWGMGKIGRFQGMSQNISYTLTPEKIKKLFGGGGDDDDTKSKRNDPEAEGVDTDIESNVDDDMIEGQRSARRKGSGHKAKTDDDGYMSFSMPWSITFGYGITMRESNDINRFNYKTMRYPYTFSQTLNFSGNLRISDGWNISFSSGYDFEHHALSMTTASLQRDLHCFNMSCQVVLAPYTSYNFTFRCNASTLTDALKYDKRSGYSNAVQWY